MEIKLTQTVQKGGCAAKVAAAELRSILAQVRFPKTSGDVLVDGTLFDDAAVHRLDDKRALVQTLDFFTPIVDTASLFGKIACANALSDVYAMGGKPMTAMAILAFPLATLPREIATEVLQGACDILSEAQTSLVGGHSIDDDTLKFGLSVTGFVHPLKIWSNAKAQPGDQLILTKGLGTGAVTAALKRQERAEADIQEALDSMTKLNRIQDFLTPELLSAIHSATDITGFGLSGHSMQMAKASQVSFEFFNSEIPALDQSRSLLESGFLTKAHRTNYEYTQSEIDFSKISDVDRLLTLDPQTSGGLLLSVQKEKAHAVVQSLKKEFPRTAIIGQVLPRAEKSVLYR